MCAQNLPGNWRKARTSLLSALSFIGFLVFDFLDTILCVLFRYIDEYFEGQTAPCYCGCKLKNAGGDGDSELSGTLYQRKNVFRELGFLGFAKKSKKNGGGGREVVNRWSDCGCDSCLSWMNACDPKLHVVVRELSSQSQAISDEECRGKPAKNVIFLHGFLSSSSFWTETVFPNLSQSANRNCRFFAIDLLGFGRSPKPRDCMYTLKDHLEMIEKSVIYPFQLDSFHLVAHSMGCLIAIALAAKHSKLVKSITLVAPPYFPSKDGDSFPSKDGDSLRILGKVAQRKLWPPFLLGTSFMSWYEHLGRCVCFLVCRNHRIWEGIIKLLTRRRDLHFTTVDLTRHTHHSAWHTMHNVICGGAKLMDSSLEVLAKAGVKVCVIHGDGDKVVSTECSNDIQIAVPHAEINIIKNADHSSVLFGREGDFTRHLEHIWASAGC